MNHLVLDRLKRFPGQVIWKEYTPQVAVSCIPERPDCWPGSVSAAARQQEEECQATKHRRHKHSDCWPGLLNAAIYGYANNAATSI